MIEAWEAEGWIGNEWYRFGIDLYNFAYWWESHEIFESLWRVTGRSTLPGRFQQALVLLAAAHWKWYLGVDRAADRLARRAMDRLADFRGPYMGIDVPALARDVMHTFGGGGSEPVLIRLRSGT